MGCEERAREKVLFSLIQRRGRLRGTNFSLEKVPERGYRNGGVKIFFKWPQL